jgi:excisionase family DNA binding protein
MSATLTADLAETVEAGFASVTEACRFLSLSRATLYKLMDAGDLRYAKFTRARRLPWREIREFAARNMVGTGAA